MRHARPLTRRGSLNQQATTPDEHSSVWHWLASVFQSYQLALSGVETFAEDHCVSESPLFD